MSVSCSSPLPSPPSLSLHFFICLFLSLSLCLSGSAGNSRSSTQMNSYSDSGYQDASSGYLTSQNMGKAELRMQHSFPGAGTGTQGKNARAEGQASAQVLPATAYKIYRSCQAQNVSVKNYVPNNTSIYTIFFN